MRKLPVHIDCEPNNEHWIKWARDRLRQLEMLRASLDVYKLQRMWVPEDGVTVWVMVTRHVAFIRITGGASDVRGWDSVSFTKFVAHLSTEAGSGIGNGSVLYIASGSGDVPSRANWSYSYDTLSWYNASGEVVLRRPAETGFVDQVISGSAKLPNDHHNGYHQNDVACMSEDGATAIVLPDTFSASVAFKLAKWNGSSFTVTDVAFPGDVPASEVDFGSVFSGYPAQTTRLGFVKRIYSPNDPSASCGAAYAPGGASNQGHVSAFTFQVTPGLPGTRKVYLYVQYERHAGTTVIDTSSSAYYAYLDFERISQVWQYDLVSQTWSLERNLTTDTARYVAHWGTYFNGSFQGVEVLPLETLGRRWHVLMFDESGALRVAECNPWPAPGSAGTYTNNVAILAGTICTGGGTANPTIGVTTDTALAELDAVDVTLDGQPWISNVAWTPAVIGGTVLPRAVSSANRGLLDSSNPGSGSGRYGSIWRWDHPGSQELHVSGGFTAKMSCEGNFLFRESGHDLQVWREGASVATVTAPAGYGSGPDLERICLAHPRLDGDFYAGWYELFFDEELEENFEYRKVNVHRMKQDPDTLVWTADVLETYPKTYSTSGVGSAAPRPASLCPDHMVQGSGSRDLT